MLDTIGDPADPTAGAGDVYVWGYNKDRQLNIESATNQNKPSPMRSLDGATCMRTTWDGGKKAVRVHCGPGVTFVYTVAA